MVFIFACAPYPSASVDAVAAPERAAAFVPLRGRLIKGCTRDVCWVRFTLERSPAATMDWFLDDVTLFVERQAPAAGGDAAAGRFEALRLARRVMRVCVSAVTRFAMPRSA